MNVNCIHCGHRFDLGKSYDDYEGLVKCSTCRGLLDIRTQDGQVRGVRPFVMGAAGAAASVPVAGPAGGTLGGPVIGSTVVSPPVPIAQPVSPLTLAGEAAPGSGGTVTPARQAA
jgi:hypothetical protein